MNWKAKIGRYGWFAAAALLVAFAAFSMPAMAEESGAAGPTLVVPTPTPPPPSPDAPGATSRPVALAGDLTVAEMRKVPTDKKGSVSIDIPLRYKGSPYVRTQLSFLEISPVIEDVTKYPFMPYVGILSTRDDLVGYTDWDGEGYMEVAHFEFPINKEIFNGYYAVNFKVRYLDITQSQRNEAPIEGTITIYVKITGAKDAPKTEDPTKTEKPLTLPRLIVSKFKPVPDLVDAGAEFTLEVEVTNTHVDRYVQNAVVFVKSFEDNILPADGSSTFYIGKIGPGEKQAHTLLMVARPDASPKPNQITISMEYEDDRVQQQKAEETFSINIQQPANLQLDRPQIPMEVTEEDMYQFDFMMPFYNKGKGTLYNVMARLESGDMEAESQYFAGTMEPGSTKEYSTMITVKNPPEGGGEVKGKLIVSYQDTYGKEESKEEEFTITVAPPMAPPDMGVMDPGMMDPSALNPPSSSGGSATLGWGLVGGGAGVLGLGTGATFVLRRRMKHREEMGSDAAE